MSINNNQSQINHDELLLFKQKMDKSELLFNLLIINIIEENRQWLYSYAQELCKEHQIYQEKKLTSIMDAHGMLELKLSNKKRGFKLEWYQNFDVIIKGNLTKIGCALKMNAQSLKYSFFRQSWLECWDKDYAKIIEEKCAMLRTEQKKLVKMRGILTKTTN